jgi:hypothetical protein
MTSLVRLQQPVKKHRREMYSLSNEEQLRVEYDNDGVKKKKRTFNTKNINNIIAEQENSENRRAQRRKNSDAENEDNGEETGKNA